MFFCLETWHCSSFAFLGGHVLLKDISVVVWGFGHQTFAVPLESLGKEALYPVRLLEGFSLV